MKILMVHNHYRSGSPSGEGRSFEAERDLLRAAGHEVVCYERHSDEIGTGCARQAVAAARAVWNEGARREIERVIQVERPDLAHFQNTFPLISPSAYAACRDARVPIVQAVRNYRHLCVAATLFRDGRPCDDCVGRVPWRGVARACYRGDRTASAAVAAVSAVQRRTRDAVSLYVAPSAFARDRLVAGGFEAARVVVKPNFVAPDPGPGDHDGGYVLYAGRLSIEKGVATVLRAAEMLRGRIRLLVVGDGPTAPQVRRAAARGDCEHLGSVTHAETVALMGGARAVLVPSLWYETFGRVVAEAYARATPVVASDLGAIAELVEHERTGLLVPPGDAGALAAAIDRLWSDPAEAERLGKQARVAFEDRYTPERNLEMLESIYRRAGQVRR